MKTRAYYAEIVEKLIASFQQDYTNFTGKCMKEVDKDKVMRMKQAIIALSIFADRLYESKTIEVEDEA